MNVIVTLQHRFEQTPDGAVWTQTQYPCAFWALYLEVFESVRVVARVKRVENAQADWKRADGEGVTFAPLPYFIGPWQYLGVRGKVVRAARAAVGAEDAVILRVPGHIPDCLEPMLRRQGQPYAVEVVSDPYDAFAPGSIKHVLAPFFRWWSPRQLRRTCQRAFAAAYVTREALQRRYPCPNESIGCSDVEIPDEALAPAPRLVIGQPRRLRLLTIGSLAQLYKGPHILIDAVAACVRQGLDLELVLVGDGQHRPELEAQAARLGVRERIQFRGQLTAGDPVRSELDRADLFVLPSFTEGLPRAMVEAMARALPCIGSAVGGIPELLPPENLVPPGNPVALAAKIREVITSPERLQQMSCRNLETAHAYRQEILRAKRIAFYRYVREHTSAWLMKQKVHAEPVPACSASCN